MLKTQQTKVAHTHTQKHNKRKNGSPSHITVNLYTRSSVYLNIPN